MIRLDELEQKAKAATPGPWMWKKGCLESRENWKVVLWPLNYSDPKDENNWWRNILGTCEGFTEEEAKNNAEYIAYMNPQTALALIRVARAARGVMKSRVMTYTMHGDDFKIFCELAKSIGEIEQTD